LLQNFNIAFLVLKNTQNFFFLLQNFEIIIDKVSKLETNLFSAKKFASQAVAVLEIVAEPG